MVHGTPSPASFAPLSPGDAVAVVAPASPIRAEMLLTGLAELVDLGLEPRLSVASAETLARRRHRFSAGTDAERLEELRWAFELPEHRAVWLARGGYGVTPLLPSLTDEWLGDRSCLVLGESDATALGCWALTQGRGWIHGPMVAGSLRLGDAGRDRASLEAAIFGRAQSLTPAGVVPLRAGSGEGVLFGGCVTLLASLCGTPFLPRIRGGIAVLEDVGVKPYQLHRMLVQLRDAGVFEDLAGVVLGDFSDCRQHPEQGYEIDEVLGDFFDELAPGVPVSLGWPIGHADAPHLSLPLGQSATLTVESDGVSRLEHPAMETA
ncbi:MAG: LD-carboxypeptidase [Acidobacteriota bacterium]